METIYPFIYKSRNEYIKYNKSRGFYAATFIFGTLVLVTIINVILGIFGLIFNNDFKACLFIAAIIPVLSYYFLRILEVGGCVEITILDSYIEEIKERRKMWIPNYQPLYVDSKELNNIVKLEDGKLFRLYQFIKPELSGKDFISYNIPKNAKIVKEDKLAEKSCMFNSLDEFELANILTPIAEYHREKEYRHKLKEDESYVNTQSALNSDISNKDIENLPLFEGFRKIEKDLKSEVDNYDEENMNNLQKYKDITKSK